MMTMTMAKASLRVVQARYRAGWVFCLVALGSPPWA